MNLRMLETALLVSSLGSACLIGCDTGTQPAPEEPDALDPGIDEQEVPLAEPVEPTALDDVLGDFESAELGFRVARGNGHWTAGDETVALGVEEGGAAGSEMALHASFDGAGSLSAKLTPAGAYTTRSIDYSTCQGLSFWAKASDAALPSVVVVDLDAGENAARATVELQPEWQHVELAWEDFSLGASVAIDEVLAGLESLRFSWESAGELWLDAVQMDACELVILNPPIPEPAALGNGAPEGSPVARHGQLRVEGAQLIDQNGEPVQLKGISSMWLNYETRPYSQDKDAMRWLRDEWKMSLFRVAMGVEESGGYTSQPDRERAKVEVIVQNAIDLGIYVIIDWHSHAAEQYLPAANAFFAEMAHKYGDTPNVIYETFNEPTRQQWSSVLKPYHESVVATIRSIDPDNVIILGNSRWSQLPIDGARDPLGASNVMYTLHFYTCEHSDVLRRDADAAMAAGAAVFVSEWGATAADGGIDGSVCEPESVPWLQWMEDNKISWAAWKWESCADGTCFIAPGANISDGLEGAELHGHAELVREWMLR